MKYTMIMASCQSGSVSSLSCTCSHGNHVKMHTCRFQYCLVVFQTLFPLLLCTIYQTIESKIKILSMLRIKLNLFLSSCQKLRVFRTICSLMAVREIGHFACILLIFGVFQLVALAIESKFKICNRYIIVVVMN